ncbi:hypothetical protein PR202_ga16954 [Eleusine coracana subsp. coracana]|uniref:Uncharacterized protein n=1 Tax=Eleusine coracana subsp. coracana TaxID=191504 RepID=A0AAV5CP76_ELECO|nr:hypothetical protein PR202_ga16954 [Eleusine coracana subsp. coracana]
MDLSGWRIASVQTVHAFNGQDQGTVTALKAAYESVPTPPAAAAWSTAAPNDGVDRISRLLDQILRNIVSRLPTNEVARTSALASRWRGLWHSVPLVFLDAGLIPGCVKNPTWRPGLEVTLGITNTVSDALKKHPGPFRCVQITCCYLDMNKEKIKEWMQQVAAKGVQELAFINRPWPFNLPLPTTLFSCTSLM